MKSTTENATDCRADHAAIEKALELQLSIVQASSMGLFAPFMKEGSADALQLRAKGSAAMEEANARFKPVDIPMRPRVGRVAKL